MCERELVKMVHVRNPKVERGQENDLGGRNLGEEMQRDNYGAEEHLLRYGSGDVVPETNAAAEGDREGGWACEPMAVGLLDQKLLEQGAKEQYGS